MINFRLILGVSIAFLVFLSMGCAKFNTLYCIGDDPVAVGPYQEHIHNVVLSPWSSPVDPTGVATTEDQAEIGYKEVDGRTVSLTLQPAEAMKMWMEMDGKWMWVEVMPEAGENILYVVKITDPFSKTRIPHPSVHFAIVNVTTDTMSSLYDLHPMWGEGGLHYAVNSNLFGDGDYAVSVGLYEPTFARSNADRGKWKGTKSLYFYFQVKNGLIVAGTVSSGTAPKVPTTPVPAHDPPTLPSDPSVDSTFMGEVTIENMRIQLFLEPAKDMSVWKETFNCPRWENLYAEGTLYHVVVKLLDETSGNRVSHSVVRFQAYNYTTVELKGDELYAMWSYSGLHYAINHNLLGSGDYTAWVIVDPPLFARSLPDGDKWMDQIRVEFTFTLDSGMITKTEGHPVS